ncbi:right-handed parallel beta-helix repeat-containing protein, partial [Bacteroidota bacterium]
TSSGTANWAISNALSANGAKSDSARIINAGDSAVLTTSAFSTSTYSFVILKFDHICKLEFQDDGYIEVSADNGSTWIRLTDSLYYGSGQFGTIANRFNAVSYIDWLPTNPNAIPTNSWWKGETFDISSIAANSSQVKIRFIMADRYLTGSGGAYGWILDDIQVVAGNSELVPPSIVLQAPVIQDTVYSTGPFDIYASISDNTGIDTAMVKYSNGTITDTVGMVNTMANTWLGSIPSQPYNTAVNYQLIATDISASANTTVYPATGSISFFTKKPLDTITIGSGQSIGKNAPFYNDYNFNSNKYSNHISLFTPAEITKAGFIKSIAWYKSSQTAYTNGDAKLRIYLKHTSLTSVPTSSGSFSTELASATLVYEDTTQSLASTIGWIEFVLNQSTFNYNGGDNLMILVDWYRPSSLTGDISWFYSTSTGNAITFQGTTPNPISFAGYGERPNIKIAMDPYIYPYDAGVFQIMSPQAVTSASGPVPIEVRIKNYGSDTLQKVTINWSIDGILKTPYIWTGSLQNEMVSNTVTLGTQLFSTGNHDIKIWTSMPNDSIDQYNLNDTLDLNFLACATILSGIYTIGGSTADFNTFADVENVLNLCGVNGTVTFNINSGIYNEQVMLSDSIPGLSSVNNITFTSASNNPADVILKYSAIVATENFVFALNGADYITIKDLTLKAEGITFGNGIYLTNGANSNVVENCRIYSIKGNNNNARGIFIEGSSSYNQILNNTIYDGYYGIYAYGTSSNPQLLTNISGNTVMKPAKYGIVGYYNDSILISSNYLFMDEVSPTSSIYGLYPYHCENSPRIIKNRVEMNLSGPGYACYYNYSGGDINNQGLVANNFFIVNGSSTHNATNALNYAYSSYTDVVHNSFLLNAGSGTAEAIYFQGSSSVMLGNHFINNNIANLNGGFAMEATSSVSPSVLAYSDYNNIYSSGGSMAKWGATVIPMSTGISGFTAVTFTDSNSVSVTPDFYSNNNLHSYSQVLNGAGTPLIRVAEDIDGELRNSITPDIGADEYDLSSTDVGVLSILEPLPIDTQSRVLPVRVAIGNFGFDTITGMSINYILDGGTPVSYTWTGNLLPGQIDTVQISQITVPVLDYELTVFTVLTGDTLNNNDTITGNFYGLPLIDASVTSLDGPASDCGLTANETVSITIFNYGVNDVSSGLTAYYKVVGGTSYVSEQITSTILAGDSLAFDFNTKVDMTVTSTDSLFEFITWVTHTQDPLNINDTLLASVNSLSNLPSPVVNDTSILFGTTATLTAISNDPVSWYLDDTTSTVYVSGNVLTTPPLYDTTIYYVQSNTNIPAQQIAIGTGTSVHTSGTNLPCPYGSYQNSRQQFLYLASELIAMGMTAGNIESIGFYIVNMPVAETFNNYEIQMGNTTTSSLTSTYVTGTSTVYSGTYVLPAGTGWTTHTLQTPFYWDGASNIVVNICINGKYNWGGYPAFRYTATSYTSFIGGEGFVPNPCSSSSGFFSDTLRPNIRLGTPATLGCASLRAPVAVNVIPLDKDATINIVAEPQSGCKLDTSDVSIIIYNHGSDTISGGLQATYRIDNNAYITPETVNGTILPGDTMWYTFSTKANLPAPINNIDYAITAKVILQGDQFLLNDTLISDTITSYYSPIDPMSNTFNTVYGQSILLSVSSPDTLYWFDSLTSNNLLYIGNQYQTPSLFDSVTYYVEAKRTIPPSNYTIGTGIVTNPSNGYPTPYGSTLYGAKHQFLIRASEMQNMGMIPGIIESLSFRVASSSGSSQDGFEIKMGLTNQQQLSSFISNLTTVYSTNSFTEVFGWNIHQLQFPFQWDGTSNIVIETCFKNQTWGTTSMVYSDTTSYISSINTTGGPSFDCSDNNVAFFYNRRPMVRFNATGYGQCASNRIPQQVNVTGIPQLDAGLIQILDPIGSAPNGTAVPVKALLKNYGTSNLISATINWKVNGSTQTPYSWSGNLSQNQTDTVMLGNYTFDGGMENIMIWVSNPNSSNDTIPVNDTVSATISVCLSGTYAVGPTQSEYQSITDAVNILMQVGVCGNVIFNIDSGSYLEHVSIPIISGTGPNSMVTFQSVTGDSSDVVISAANTQVNNYVIEFEGASYFRLHQITLISGGTAYGNAVTVEFGASHIYIENCELRSIQSTSSTYPAYGVYNGTNDIHHIYIRNSVIKNGYHGIRLAGVSNSRLNNIVIENNELYDFNSAGLYLYYIDTVSANGNLIISGTSTGYYYGMRFWYNQGSIRISSNNIILFPVTYGYGIDLYNSSGSSSDYGLVDNNFISLLSGTGDNKGLYMSYNHYIHASFNSVNIATGASGSRALYVSNSGSNQKFLNNIFAVDQGYTIYVTSPNVITAFDHNDLFVNYTTPNYAYWSGAVANLSALKILDLTKNVNSIDIDPNFMSSSDLHTFEYGLNAAGTPVSGITQDIDGDTRNSTTPDIGADEFTPSAKDMGAVALIHPSSSTCGLQVSDSVVVRIRNIGYDTLQYSTDPVTVQVIMSGITSDTLLKILNTGNILPGATQDIVVNNNVNLALNGMYVFDVKTILATDGNNLNDALQTVSVTSYPTINTFPFSDDFETGSNITFIETVGYDAGLSVDNQASNGGSYGLHFEGGSYSGYTTPSNVSQAYGNTFHLAIATTCNIDATLLSSLSMKFDLKQTYSSSSNPNYSWFRVMVTDQFGTYYLKNVNGDSVYQANLPDTDPFVTHIYDLSSWVGKVFTISFESSCKLSYGTGSYLGDNAFLDNLYLWTPITTDVALTSFIEPDPPFTNSGGQAQVKVTVTNFGTDTVSTIPVGYSINGGLTVWDTLNKTLIPNALDTVDFSVPFSVITGNQTLCAFTSLTGDNFNSNDTNCMQFKGITTITVDYIDDFELQDLWAGYGTSNQWERGTPGATTINTTHSGNNVWATNLSGDYQENSTEYLYTPYIIIPTNADTALLEFWQWMVVQTGFARGRIQYSLNYGQTWLNLGYTNYPGSVNWYNHTAVGTYWWSATNISWTRSAIKLDPVAFNLGIPIQFRFEFVAGTQTTTTDGWAIDDFSITIPPMTNDAGVSQILEPMAQTIIGNNIAVEVIVKNYGADTLMSIPLAYKAGNLGEENETWTGTLYPDSSVNFIFTNTFAAPVTDYNICVYTLLPGDNQPNNDTSCQQINALPGGLDAGISVINTPTGQTTINSTVDVEAIIKNFGTDTIYSVPLEYTVNGNLTGQETFNGTIIPGDTVTYTFNTTFNSPVGLYQVCVLTLLNWDVNGTNDTLCEVIAGTGIDEAKNYDFIVSQNIPNPANNKTRFLIHVPQPGNVQFSLYNIIGDFLFFDDLKLNKGENEFVFDVQKIEPGIYLAVFEYQGSRIVRQIIVQ